MLLCSISQGELRKVALKIIVAAHRSVFGHDQKAFVF